MTTNRVLFNMVIIIIMVVQTVTAQSGISMKFKFNSDWKNINTEKSLQEKERSGQPRKYGPKQEAEIIALACSDPPEGRARWSLELLTEKLSGHKGLGSINRETIRLMLKKTNVSLG